MPDNYRSLAKKIDKLAARIDKLESGTAYGVVAGSGDHDGDLSDGPYFCGLPVVPPRVFAPDVSSDRERLIVYMDKKWVNGTVLHYYFFAEGAWAGPAGEMQLVRDGFKVWEDVGIGVRFEEVDNIEDAEIRIGFLQGDGAWSYVGRDVIDIPGQFERTMNYGWRIASDPRGVDVAVHEIGHTLGFPHEHQNPFAGIVWDEEAVYNYFGGPPNNWPRQQTFHNVLRKLPAATVEGSDWDPDSIMHYGIAPGLILQPDEFRNGITPELGLSDHDMEEVKRFYPPIADSDYPQLEVFRPRMLSLNPGDQSNFLILPEATRDYTMQTFGRSDTVMVLFEERDGELRYVDGDDDSGLSTNSKIEAKLIAGKRYVLRIRLYLSWASGKSAVMLW
ncbi:MAG: M12 family metallopeptidase [Rhizobiaceae bacterium]